MARERPIKLILNEVTKKEEARNFLRPIFRRGDMQKDDVIAAMMQRLKIANNTAITYYHMLAKDLGVKDDEEDNKMGGGGSGEESDDIDLSDEDGELEDDEGGFGSEEDDFETAGNFDTDEDGNVVVDPDELEDGEFVKNDDPDRQGVIRTVKGAKLVYKRENSQGLYDEMWIFNIHTTLNKETDIKQDILAGTDIPPRSTRSEDGVQKYTLTTLGNAQILLITNLSQ